MKKRSLFKVASALAMAVTMMIGVSTTAFAATYDVWDDETGSRIAFEPSDRPAVIVNIDKTMPEGQRNVDLKEYEVTVLNSDDKIWVDSSKSTANINNIATYSDEGWAYCGYTIYLQNESGVWYDDGGAPDLPFEFDNKSLFKEIDFQLSIDNVKNKPHIIVVSVNGKDGSLAGYYFSYYQGFQSNVTNSATSSWASDAKGWWIQNSDGSYLTNTWYQDTDGKWYYMGSDGYMLTNATTPDGYYVNETGICQ